MNYFLFPVVAFRVQKKLRESKRERELLSACLPGQALRKTLLSSHKKRRKTRRKLSLFVLRKNKKPQNCGKTEIIYTHIIIFSCRLQSTRRSFGLWVPRAKLFSFKSHYSTENHHWIITSGRKKEICLAAAIGIHIIL